MTIGQSATKNLRTMKWTVLNKKHEEAGDDYWSEHKKLKIKIKTGLDKPKNKNQETQNWYNATVESMTTTMAKILKI